MRHHYTARAAHGAGLAKGGGRPGGVTPGEAASGERLRALREDVREVCTYFNNRIDGHAVENTVTLGEIFREAVE